MIPNHDILISGNHHILLKHETGFVLVPARSLPISTKFLTSGVITYFHLVIEDNDGFFVSGLAVESYI